MAQRNIQPEIRRRVLRRRSWPVLTWGGIALLWSLYLLVLLAFLAHENYPDISFVAAAMLAATALLRRIGSCGVVLLPDSMRVENLIRFYRIPYACVRDVHVAPTGGLEIETLQGEVVRGFAFGGSFVDAFFKTSERAAVEIGGRVAPARDLSV
ncbi:hypothetical protein ACWCQ1_51840 [Streptomyces sp. NPDC002144]